MAEEIDTTTDTGATDTSDQIEEAADSMLENEGPGSQYAMLPAEEQDRVREDLIEQLERLSHEDLLKLEEKLNNLEQEKEGQEYEM